MTNMKITLAEKPKLIPSTPPLPATLEGSLQPSQAIAEGAFAKTAPINEARKSRITPTCAISSGRAIDKPKIRPRGVMECRRIGLSANCTPRLRVGDAETHSSARSVIFVAIVSEKWAQLRSERHLIGMAARKHTVCLPVTSLLRGWLLRTQ